jgi:Ca-activated chloride channel family protein
MLLLTLCVVGSLSVPAIAQTDVNDIHVAPREVEKAKTEEVANQSIVSPSLNTHVRPLKVGVDLVLVPVTITDPMNRLVTGLEKDNFQLFEGSAPQEIKSFSSEMRRSLWALSSIPAGA